MHLATTIFQAPVHLALHALFPLLPYLTLHFSWQPPYWHKPPSTPGLQHLFGIPIPLSLFCKANAGDRRLMGSGVPVNKGLRPSCLHLINGDLHEPALGLGLDLAQPHRAQPLPQHALCMSTSCPGWSLSWLTSPALHCPQRATLGPSETELWRGAGEWDYPVTKGDLGRSPPSFHDQGSPPTWFSNMQVPHFVNLLTYWFH